jgi:hypothetical protein
MKKFKDFYGCTATIKEQTDGQFKLTIKTGNGKTVINKPYNTYKGARAAMNRNSDGWNEVE